MSLNLIELEMQDGRLTNFGEFAGKTVLVVNVASKCGLTPQYEALEALYKKYADRGLVIVGVPSDTFKQEFKDDASIAEFCSLNYGVTFPLTKLAKVNGRNRHPLFKELVKAKDGMGLAGPVMWNFEKFLVSPNGKIQRFRPNMKPDDPAIVAAIEASLGN
ncbi:glutathione peroxidase [Candidatus Rhodoluna planktonica]|uniref:Glutathione peroxidase n=1 Tax=Candidatus Rhodoluna planktonica TaxID=535712 RepID=A0A1D9E0G7_9MICO|nr:glutathione peroxidase [Candidatus Rhodoluna planktonica]AOY56558.1 glutathione peroxidase [Candidatus Rhodoluna planktonica]